MLNIPLRVNTFNIKLAYGPLVTLQNVFFCGVLK